MFYWLFVRMRSRLSPRWLGEEAFRSGIRSEANPYAADESGDAARRWADGWESEKQMAIHSSLGPAFSPSDWRGWVTAFLLVGGFMVCVFAAGMRG
jgi:hypothetical protein